MWGGTRSRYFNIGCHDLGFCYCVICYKLWLWDMLQVMGYVTSYGYGICYKLWDMLQVMGYVTSYGYGICYKLWDMLQVMGYVTSRFCRLSTVAAEQQYLACRIYL